MHRLVVGQRLELGQDAQPWVGRFAETSTDPQLTYMRTVTFALAVSIASSGASLIGQGINPPTFEVVSIKRNLATTGNSSVAERPDGSVTFINQSIATLISRAYPPTIPRDMVGLPDWAVTERYDVIATSPLVSASAEVRTRMLQRMLTDRFNLVLHFEERPQEGYELVRASERIGPQVTKLDIDCDAILAAQAAGGAASPRLPPPDPAASLPPCTTRMGGNRLVGDTTFERLTTLLRVATGRPVVDKTGLEGWYRVSLSFDIEGTRRGPTVDVPDPADPLLFTALQEQFAMRLVRKVLSVRTIVIDRLERPTAN